MRSRVKAGGRVRAGNKAKIRAEARAGLGLGPRLGMGLGPGPGLRHMHMLAGHPRTLLNNTSSRGE